MGPGAWEGAKKAIEDAPGNVIYATKTRILQKKEQQGTNTAAVCLKLLALFVVLISIIIRFSAENLSSSEVNSPWNSDEFRE